MKYSGVMSLVVKSFDELVEQLKNKSFKVMSVDGRDGSGKTYLSEKLNEHLGGSILSEVTYRSAGLAGKFEYDKIKILHDLAEALNKPPVIFESCFMLLILKDIGLKPSASVYVKPMSETTDQWTDEDELDMEPTKELALEKEISFGRQIGISPSNFRLQMIEYHYDFKPHENSSIIFERVEKFGPDSDY